MTSVVIPGFLHNSTFLARTYDYPMPIPLIPVNETPL
jgi:hypothetical protein